MKKKKKKKGSYKQQQIGISAMNIFWEDLEHKSSYLAHQRFDTIAYINILQICKILFCKTIGSEVLFDNVSVSVMFLIQLINL